MSSGRDAWPLLLPLSVALYWAVRKVSEISPPPDLSSYLPALLAAVPAAGLLAYGFSAIGRGRKEIEGYEFVGFRLRPMDKRGELSIELSELMDLLSSLGVSSAFVLHGPHRGEFGPSAAACGVIWSEGENSREILSAAMRLMRSFLKGAVVEELGDATARSLAELALSLATTPGPHFSRASFSGMGESSTGPAPTAVPLGTTPSGGEFLWDLGEIVRHVAILGRTGSGKTTTAMTIARLLWDAGVPFLVLDYHGEYGMMTLELGGRIIKAEDLSVNLLEGLSGWEPRRIGSVIEVLDLLLNLTPTQLFIVERCLNRLQGSLPPGEAPTLADLYEEISEFRERTGPEFESKLSLMRKMDPLVTGEGAQHLMRETLPDLDAISEAPLVVEVGGISTPVVRDAVAHSILGRVYDGAKRRGKTGSPFLAVILEEADHIMPRLEDRRGMTISDKMFSELRKFGVGMMVISQTPSGLSRHVLRNSSTKIFHALGEPEDIRAAISLIGREVELGPGRMVRAADVLPILEVGEAVVVREGGANLIRVRRPEYAPTPVDLALKILKREAPGFYNLPGRAHS